MSSAVVGADGTITLARDANHPLDLGEGERWFAARTHPHRENTAHSNLQRLGFRSYVPRFWRTIRHARKLNNVFSPLFPGYIFVILNLSRDRWRSVNSTTGVASLIMGVDRPAPVPSGVVETLIARHERSRTAGFDGDLNIGDTVRILSGPFAEALCNIERLDDRGRVRVLLQIMGGLVAVQVNRSSLGRTITSAAAVRCNRDPAVLLGSEVSADVS